MTSLLFGLLHPHTLAKLCSVFKVLTLATQVAFVIISEAIFFVKNFFWYFVIYLSSLVISDSRQLNILPSLNLLVKNFFKFIFCRLSYWLATSNYITWFISELQELFILFWNEFCHRGFASTRLYLRYRIILILASIFSVQKYLFHGRVANELTYKEELLSNIMI